ncbi:ACT domain-containing protein [Jimgerdemannia flammicorona]|uniref:ACT domain-containing protein n=1 Tax=Jimgerdemannia flammicorona TaxID=994334 RepID=A0A433A040_9FUNG|nr:ACT domain-containing protein [Jimgerdemannia flammicorona]
MLQNRESVRIGQLVVQSGRKWSQSNKILYCGHVSPDVLKPPPPLHQNFFTFSLPPVYTLFNRCIFGTHTKSSIMTITILPARLKLLHFPKSTLPHATHAIIKACFFDISYTENSLEVSIVAENHVVENEFLPSLNAACSEIEVSEETFRALQIDDDTGQSSYSSGRRISELSEPLAQAQFSIFYMSTYQTDFILVKEKRLAQAVTALLQHGFEMDMDSVDEQVPSLVVAQVHRINGNGYGGDDDAEVASLADPENGSHNDYDHPAEQNFGVRWEKIVLRNELRCAGLNRDFIQSWALNIIKVLFYPEMVAGYE